MDKRLKYKIKALESIDKLFDQKEKMELKRDNLSEKLKESYDHQIAALSKKRAELRKELEEIENSSESNWEETKEIFSESMKHYKAGFAELGKLFK